jgi:hypothetical protein
MFYLGDGGAIYTDLELRAPDMRDNVGEPLVIKKVGPELRSMTPRKYGHTVTEMGGRGTSVGFGLF